MISDSYAPLLIQIESLLAPENPKMANQVVKTVVHKPMLDVTVYLQLVQKCSSEIATL